MMQVEAGKHWGLWACFDTNVPRSDHFRFLLNADLVNLETEHILTPMSDLSSNRVLQTYQIGPEGKRANVIHYAANDNQHERRNINANEPIKHPNVTTIDMTPAKCTSSQCYIGKFSTARWSTYCVRHFSIFTFNHSSSSIGAFQRPNQVNPLLSHIHTFRYISCAKFSLDLWSHLDRLWWRMGCSIVQFYRKFDSLPRQVTRTINTSSW